MERQSNGDSVTGEREAEKGGTGRVGQVGRETKREGSKEGGRKEWRY